MNETPRDYGMNGREQVSSLRKAAPAGYLLVAISLSLLAGCATGGKAKVGANADPAEPASAVVALPSPSLSAGPSVVHYADGRQGFVIKEPSGLGPDVRTEFDQANTMIREAKFDTAIELLEKVIARAPELTAPHINVAIAYRQANKPEQAEEHLKKALESIPGHPVASNEYGLLLRRAGRFAESRQVYETSLDAFPEYYPVHKNLGVLCDLYLKDAACAVKHYEIYGKAMPKDAQVKLWLADLQNRSGSTMTASAGRQHATPRP